MPAGLSPVAPSAAIRARQFSHLFGARPTLKNLDLDIRPNEIFGIIGPAGSGKSTFLRALNRLNDLVPESKVQGRLEVGGLDIYAPGTSVVELRRRLGMVFATPVPLPRSIFENVAFGARLSGVKGQEKLRALVTDALEKTALWDEVKDRLFESAVKLSGGQQQRLCLARVLALRPEFILLDEPTSGLDPAQGRIHDRAGHQQHQAGGPGRRPDGVFPGRRAHRGRRYRQDLFRAVGRADERLHPGEVRVRSGLGHH